MHVLQTVIGVAENRFELLPAAVIGVSLAPVVAEEERERSQREREGREVRERDREVRESED